MEIKKKIFDLQNHEINVVIHNTLNAKWMGLTIVCACTFFLSDRFHLTGFTQFLVSNSQKKTFLLLS